MTSILMPGCWLRRHRPAASFAITQLFFTADDYFALVARVRHSAATFRSSPGSCRSRMCAR